MHGVRPIGIGETFLCFIAKVVILARQEIRITCKTDNLCGGLAGDIDGVIYAVQATWDAHRMEEDYEELLIEAHN
jgi:hypothetical protein